MSTALDRHCGLLVHYPSELPKVEELKQKLESKDDDVKVDGLKTVILNMVNGENMSKLLMHVIKFCLHTDNHMVKKLLLLYWEAVDKKLPNGQLRPEMILVCNAMKNNLNHPNEYIRGSTLRFLCNMKEAEILESLIPYVSANLEHRHSYVRKNAVLAVFTIYQAHTDLIPDAPELIEKFLDTEANASAKRNAFLALFQCDADRAVVYLTTVLEAIGSTDESFQMVALEVMRKVCRQASVVKSQYVRVIYSMTNSSSNAVAYEAANSLVTMSSAPTAIRAAVAAYVRLLNAESDNNVKLVILDRLVPLRERHEKILQELLLDLMRILSSPNIDIRRKTIELMYSLLSPNNVDDVVQVLKKELTKSEAPDQEKSEEYRKLLVDAMHRCTIKFPQVVETVAIQLMNYIGDDNCAFALRVAAFVREVVEVYPKMRNTILMKLLDDFDTIRFSTVYRVVLWILGEYASEPGVLDAALAAIHAAVGEMPLLEKKEAKEDADNMDEPSIVEVTAKRSRPVVLADGTYAQQSAAQTASAVTTAVPGGLGTLITLRTLILDGDYMVACGMSSALTKLLLRFCVVSGYGIPESNEAVARGLLVMSSVLRLGTDKHSKHVIDEDSKQRIVLCIKALLNPKPTSRIFLEECRKGFARLLAEARAEQEAADRSQDVVNVKQADDLISIRQLKGVAIALGDIEDEDDADLSRALGVNATKSSVDFDTNLKSVYQLTGFADPVYAEANVVVLGFDVLLKIHVKNQTNRVLQNLCVELSTSRDLKVVERPQMYNIAAYASVTINANIKVSSTESGVIFGNIVYESSSGSEKTIVVLNSIHMDIVDYMKPCSVDPSQFRTYWAEFEWENKIAVNTDITDVHQYLQHIVHITNMQCMTDQKTLRGTANFLAANLYAKSLFGEAALLNLSVEKTASGKINGYIRIRCKAQGIALSLGDKITTTQRTISTA